MGKRKKKKPLLETGINLPFDFELSSEFRETLKLMEETSNNIYITGNAGTGKSTLLEYFRQITGKKIVVLAPTGVAAVKAGGQTIHSFFRFPPRYIHESSVKKLKNRSVIESMDTLVIDEASMVRADIFDGIDISLRKNTGNINLPFGGVQVILFGDLFQLSPVVSADERELLYKNYETPYFFSARAVAGMDLIHCELSKIYRQKDDEFIQVLNRVRNRQVTPECLELLNSRVETAVEHGKSIITLNTTNREANEINSRCLAGLPHKMYVYESSMEGDFDEKQAPAEPSLRLKEGAQVMMLNNDPAGRWVNGTLAQVYSLDKDYISVKISEQVHEVKKFEWEKIKYAYNESADKIEEKKAGVFRQYPLKLAWAITIHKSQGQTFDDVIIDIGKGAFTHGQLYVALSRCTTFKGIKLKRPVSMNDIIFDDRVCASSAGMRRRTTLKQP